MMNRREKCGVKQVSDFCFYAVFICILQRMSPFQRKN